MPVKPTRKYFGLLLLLAAVFFQTIPSTSYAGASLGVAPTRVVFEGRERTATVGLINRGNETAVFRISFQEMRMTENGKIEVIENPPADGMYASKMVRYSPRQVTLPPGKAQVVRILLRKPPGLPDGEYRSHMLFREVPRDTSSSITKELGKNREFKIRIIPVVGISIPVIVRQGKLEATAGIDKLSFTPANEKLNSGTLSLEITRTGNESVYGDFTVKLKQKDNEIVVGKANGVALYTPNTHRNFSIKIQAPENVQLNSGELEVIYSVPPSDGDRVFGKATLSLQ
jgi:P pilus assembly chaperone PapD